MALRGIDCTWKAGREWKWQLGEGGGLSGPAGNTMCDCGPGARERNRGGGAAGGDPDSLDTNERAVVWQEGARWRYARTESRAWW